MAFGLYGIMAFGLYGFMACWLYGFPVSSPPVPIVAVANQKGGVGKTTVVVSLSAALSRMGREVLAVDLDPQMALTAWLFGEDKKAPATIYEALFLPRKFRDAILPSEEGFQVAVSSLDLAGAEVELLSLPDRHLRLKEALAAGPKFDWVILDCPPSLGLLTLNALVAADYVLIPVSCDYLALRGLALLFATIRRVQEELNPGLKLLGVIPNLYESRTLHAREVLEALGERFGELLLPPVRKSVRFREAPVAGKSILAYEPSGEGARAFQRIAEEVVRRGEAGGAERGKAAGH